MNKQNKIGTGSLICQLWMDSCNSQCRKEALVWCLLPWCSSQRALPILLQKSESDAKIWDISEPYSLICCESWPLYKFGTGYCIYLKFPVFPAADAIPSFPSVLSGVTGTGKQLSHSAWGCGSFSDVGGMGSTAVCQERPHSGTHLNSEN